MKHHTRSTMMSTALCATMLLVSMADATASSHREAPFITEIPKADGTDFYLFNSYEAGREEFVTLVANYVPFQDPYGGPNYFTMDPNALYEIHVDNNGDAREDITFQFRFNSELNDITIPVNGKDISIPLINAGAVTVGDDSNVNAFENYKVSIVRGNRRKGHRQSIINAQDNATTFSKPLDNIGTKSIPDYSSYAGQYLYDIQIPGCDNGRLFVGQRKDPFVLNAGEVFDLINTNPLGAEDGEQDDLDDKNITSLILEVPKTCLTNGADTVIGAWTTASLRQGRLLRRVPSFDRPALEGGPWAQVSRLGMPLVNEVVIGLKDKNLFNAAKPRHDSQFLDYVTTPTLPALIEILFPSAPAPTLFPRTDLVDVFLKGVEGINRPANVTAAEMLRLNTATPATAAGEQSRLGVIGGDSAGFPNGRRPGDDIVDITLRVAMGKLIALGLYGTPDQAPAGNAPITDGAFIDDSYFSSTFPYLLEPLPGANGL